MSPRGTWGFAEGLGSDSAAGGVYGACRADTGSAAAPAPPCTTRALHVPARLARALGQPARGPVQPPARGATDHAPSAAGRVPGADCQRLCFRGNTRLE